MLFKLLFILSISFFNNIPGIKANPNCKVKWNALLKRNIYSQVDVMPHYIGGDVALNRFVYRNYHLNSEGDFQGTIKVSFIVDEKGCILNLGILGKKIKEITHAEKEALRVFKMMPQWIAGKCQSKIVPVYVTVPIRF